MQKSSLVVQPEIMQAQEYGLTKERIMITPKMNILQIPIIDEFSASSKSKWTAEFVAKKGFGKSLLNTWLSSWFLFSLPHNHQSRGYPYI
ncbi:hypothetical protein BS47DRAFT_1337308, partial [Hydnum rufescens UP504]